MIDFAKHEFVGSYNHESLPGPDDTDSVPMNAFQPVEGGRRGLPPDQQFVFFAVHGDYGGDITDKVNYDYFIENHADTEGELWWRVYADYGGRGIAIRADADEQDEEIAETLERYAAYPILDEDAESNLEQEQHVENWDDWARADFKRDLMEALGDDGPFAASFDELSKEDEKKFLDELSFQLMERSEKYPEHESGTVDASRFPLEEWIESIHDEAELLVMLDYFREHGKLRGFAG